MRTFTELVSCLIYEILIKVNWCSKNTIKAEHTNVPVHLHTHLQKDFCKDTERPVSHGSLPASLGVPASNSHFPSPLFEGTVSSRCSECVKDNEEGTVFFCVCGSFMSDTAYLTTYSCILYCPALLVPGEHNRGDERLAIPFFDFSYLLYLGCRKFQSLKLDSYKYQ